MSLQSGRMILTGDAVLDRNLQLIIREFDLEHGTVVDVTFPHNTGDYAITHGLGVIPNSFAVENQDRPGSVFNGATKWTDTTVYLQTDTPGMRCLIRLRQTAAD